jgi:trigger factor
MAASPLSVDVEHTGNSQVALRVESSAADVNDAVGSALRRLAGRVRIPGFRPGKAPVAMVERAVGWEAVRRDAVEHLVPDLYRRALDQAAIDPVGEPALDVGTLERDQPLAFTATVTVRPEVRLGDYQSLRVPLGKTEVTDAQVDEALDGVRRAQAELRDVDRPAREGDLIRGTLTMQRNGEPLSAEDPGERDLELDRSRLIDGIVDGIVGMPAGETRTFDVKLPDDYQREELRGATVSVEAEVRAVRERELPPLDDALASRDGHGTTLEELRAHYRERLDSAAAEADRERFESDALKALRDVATVDIPELMIEREIERQLADLEYRMASLGLPFDKYLEITGETMEKLRGERRESAVQRIKLELALDALATAEGIEVDETQVAREAKRLAEGEKLDASQRRRLNDLARRDLRRRAAADRLLEIARSDEPEFVQT